MKNNDLKIALLPRGINDLLEEKSFQESFLSESLMNIFKLNGYEKVSPPLIEFEENYTLFFNEKRSFLSVYLLKRSGTYLKRQISSRGSGCNFSCPKLIGER